MENLLTWTLKSAAGIGLIYIVLSLFNVHWLMRIRIIASLALGALILGALGWRMVSPVDPMGAITLHHSSIGIMEVIICAGLAFLSGAGGYLVSYPYGKILGLLAAPAGMAMWALNSGNMRMLMLKNVSAADRMAVYSFLRWELLFWFGLVLAGAAGCWLMSRSVRPKVDPFAADLKKPLPAMMQIGWSVVSIVAAVVIAQFLIRVFAQDIRYNDAALESVIGQPGNRQIAFAVFAAFLAAAFAAKALLNGNFYAILATAPILGIFVIQTQCTQDVLEHMSSNWSPVYFPNALCSILPIQLVSFSAIGALAGYWLAIKYREAKSEL